MLVGSWGHVGGWIFPLFAPGDHHDDVYGDVYGDGDDDGGGDRDGEDVLEEEEAVDEDGKHDGVEATRDQVHSSNVPVKGLKYFLISLCYLFLLNAVPHDHI